MFLFTMVYYCIYITNDSNWTHGGNVKNAAGKIKNVCK